MKKKKIVLLSSLTLAMSVGAVLTLSTSVQEYISARGENTYQMTLSSENKGSVYSFEDTIHQIKIKNNKFDLVGWSSTGGGFGSIKTATYGPSEYVYRGMIYNRSAINDLNSLCVKFSGGSLHYVFSEFLMENMDFDGAALTSEETVVAPAGSAYFIIYTDVESETPVNIDSVSVGYDCAGSVDNQMIYNKTTSLGGARSSSKTTVKEDSFIELENNPTKNNNNYSVGAYYKCLDESTEKYTYTFVSETTPTECPHCHSENIKKINNSSWYRWNGKYFVDSEDLGTDFEFGLTIMGQYSRMVDESKFFHYNVWPQFSYGNSGDEPWVQTYIGNDNYEPLGKDHALRPTDPYVKESYAGRFFTDYNWFDNKWTFADPDTHNIADGSMTFRAAYQKYNLPFWHLKFHVYLDENSDACCDITINGMLIYSDSIFDDYDTVNTPSIHIHTLPMHLINYGVDADGNPGESYKGYFTYPRIIG